MHKQQQKYHHMRIICKIGVFIRIDNAYHIKWQWSRFPPNQLLSKINNQIKAWTHNKWLTWINN